MKEDFANNAYKLGARDPLKTTGLDRANARLSK
jgi:hypothetical protein